MTTGSGTADALRAAAYPPFAARGRGAGIALALLVHAALLFGWQAAQRPPRQDADGAARALQWIVLPPPAPAPRTRDAAPARVPAASAPTRRPAAQPAVPATPAAGTVAAPAASPDGAVAPALPPAPAMPAQGVPAAPPSPSGTLQRALRDAGAVDRALRKENHPYIVAPLDSPQLRMRRGMQAAADLAPGKWYEAPKVEELVNNTGDGARRTRIVTGNGTYCVTERATNTSIDMIEKHGKLRLTNCPAHETPAAAQAWRTARD
ncbi:hypothetical protein [uncultured Massilia sp.]|uniref:hypothetical protein n=1 Tax=uncultured Massilia sp. TaxID=169973 RepID=UPI0025E335C3|nr:hypothetical protein [uncultured Massilia sp.]